MPAPYSHDLRLRVMDAVRNGMVYEEVTQRFRVSNSTILRWVRRLRESGSYAALPMGGKKPFVLADERDWLLQRFKAKPDLTLRELWSELRDRGIEVSYFALWHSPDLNPIEQVFAKIKTLLRKHDPRTIEATWRSVGTVLERFTPQECQRYLKHAGYQST